MPQTKRTVKGVLGGLLGLVGLSAVAGVLVTAAVTPAIALAGVSGSQALSIFDELPNSLTPGTPMEPSVIYGNDENGKPFELARFYDQNRQPVTFDQVSPLLYDAILSSEDKSFYSHGGINIASTAKAMVDYARGTSTRGASTISQQFVKMVQIQECEKGVSPSDPEYDKLIRDCWTEFTEAKGAEGIERKLQELRYAVQIEKDYSKNEILLGYLNIASFGGQTYGIEAASKRYFNTTAKNLTLTQAATLAGIVQNPNRLRIDMPGGTVTDKDGNPINDEASGYAETLERRNYVLTRMHADGKITQEQFDAAMAEPITPSLSTATQGCTKAGDQAYFCQYVKSIVESDPAFGDTAQERSELLKRGGLHIYSSLDMRVQRPGVEAMKNNVPQYLEGVRIAGSGVTIEVGTGRVLAIVQNTKFNETDSSNPDIGESGLVYATDYEHGGSTGFPVGSTYKLFTLVEWLKQGHSVNEVLDGRFRLFSPFTVCGNTEPNNARTQNFGRAGGFVGTPMRFTATSLNTGFYAMAQQLDLCEINKTAQSMGVLEEGVPGGVQPITADNTLYASTLGSKHISPLQMASAYGTVANKGVLCTPRAIDKVVGPDGEEKPLPASSCAQAIPENVAATAAHALRGVMNGGTGGAANTYDGIPLIGKTGTHEAFATAMTTASTKTATFVYVGKNGGPDFSLAGYGLNNVRFPIARALQGAANAVYGGDQFAAPDRNLTRQVLKDLPDVTGKSIEEATDILSGAGFSVTVGDPVDSEIGAGLVGEQSPGAGQVAGGTTVTLRPSTGKSPDVTVPRVTGEDYPDARSALEGAGFSVSGSGCSDDSTVTSQSPGAGSDAPRGSTITVTCS